MNDSTRDARLRRIYASAIHTKEDFEAREQFVHKASLVLIAVCVGGVVAIWWWLA